MTAAFALPASHPAFAMLKEQGIEAEGELVIRRIQNADGPSRAAINDQPVSLNLLRQIAGALAEIHGQHADRALVDVGAHRAPARCLRRRSRAERHEVAALWDKTSVRRWPNLSAHRRLMERAEAERDYLEHAAEELRALNPVDGEEAKLAEARQMMMSAEQYAEALAMPRRRWPETARRSSRLNAALRKLERRRETAGGRLDHVCQSLDRVLAEIGEAERAHRRGAARLRLRSEGAGEIGGAALRAARRRAEIQVHGRHAGTGARALRAELAALSDGGSKLRALETRWLQLAREAYDAAAEKLSDSRRKTAKALDKAVMAELPPLKLERARFETPYRDRCRKARAVGHRPDRIHGGRQSGHAPGPLMKVASGGELARFMLALKVVLAAKGSAPTLIFDEIDTGVGGAVADAIGARLARLAEGLQVLAVTHSPQVAARAGQHMLISKMEEVAGKRMVTRVQAPVGAEPPRGDRPHAVGRAGDRGGPRAGG